MLFFIIVFFFFTCNASASSLRSSSVFIVTNLSTNRSSDAATTARPNRMNINVNATYSSLSFNVLFFCNATMSPNLQTSFSVKIDDNTNALIMTVTTLMMMMMLLITRNTMELTSSQFVPEYVIFIRIILDVVIARRNVHFLISLVFLNSIFLFKCNPIDKLRRGAWFRQGLRTALDITYCSKMHAYLYDGLRTGKLVFGK